MRRLSFSDVLFWLLTALSLLALGVLVLVLAGVVPIDPPPEPASADTAAPASAAPVLRTTSEAEPPPARTLPAKPQPPKTVARTVVVVTASRGDSWISVREGSESGRLLDERLLPEGESARFEGKRVWLSLGAAGNVDLTVDGKPRSLGSGTVSGVLGPS